MGPCPGASSTQWRYIVHVINSNHGHSLLFIPWHPISLYWGGTLSHTDSQFLYTGYVNQYESFNKLALTGGTGKNEKEYSWHVPAIKFIGMKQLVSKVAKILEKLRYLWKWEIWGKIVKIWYSVNNCLIKARI